ncbi:MAG: hypothetical protein MI924_25950, partial [Chloroflexales bacterium]|nr:hypothetical protein [Chloroflexales bacterium]
IVRSIPRGAARSQAWQPDPRLGRHERRGGRGRSLWQPQTMPRRAPAERAAWRIAPIHWLTAAPSALLYRMAPDTTRLPPDRHGAAIRRGERSALRSRNGNVSFRSVQANGGNESGARRRTASARRASR